MTTQATDPPLQFGLRFDMRAPGHLGVDPALQYREALAMCEWADEHGFTRVELSEHHGADDGYCPAPIVLAAAIAGRTRHLRIGLSALILPLHDPLELAEQIAVLDHLAPSRIEVTLGAGYRRAEYELLGRSWNDRFQRLEDGIATLRQAWDHALPPVVTPRPTLPGPSVFLAGSSLAAARRAARVADGFRPTDDRLYDAYLAACAELGRPPGPPPPPVGPMFVHISHDPEDAWSTIGPFALHDADSYGRWLAEHDLDGPYRRAASIDEVRESGSYCVLTPSGCADLVADLGGLTLHPLMGGLQPACAWSSLELFASEILPRFARRLPRHDRPAQP